MTEIEIVALVNYSLDHESNDMKNDSNDRQRPTENKVFSKWHMMPLKYLNIFIREL